LAYEGDGKKFYSFKTPAGNVFYLIIDHERNTDNVYFLNAVTEQDLLALAEGAGNNKNSSYSAIPTPTPPTVEPNSDKDNNTVTDPNPEKPPVKSNNNTGMIVFVLIGVLVVG